MSQLDEKAINHEDLAAYHDQLMQSEMSKKADKTDTYTKTEVNGLVDTPHQNYVTVSATSQTTDVTTVLPASGQAADTIYRVSNWDGSANNGAGAFDVTKYSEYAWDDQSTPNKYVFLCVKTAIGEVFDISVYNNNATYPDLATALGANGANVPPERRQPGMRVQYVHSVDNKYVQFRLMSDSFNTTVANWQGVDDIPTAGSDNLVKSSGIFPTTEGLKSFIRNNAVVQYTITGEAFKQDGTIWAGLGSNYERTEYIPIVGIKELKGNIAGNGTIANVIFFDINKIVITALTVVGTTRAIDLDLTSQDYANAVYVGFSRLVSAGDGAISVICNTVVNQSTLDSTVANINKKYISKKDIFDVIEDYITEDATPKYIIEGEAWKQDGTIWSGLGDNYKRTGKIRTQSIKRITGNVAGNGTIATVIFFDASNNLLSDLTVVGTNGSIDLDLTTPAYINAKYVAFTRVVTTGSGALHLTNDLVHNPELNALKSDVTNNYIHKNTNPNYSITGQAFKADGTIWTGLGDGYARTEIFSSVGLLRIVGKVGGNGTIVTVAFFDSSQTRINSLNVVGSSGTDVDIDLTSSDYANVRYVGFSKSNSSSYGNLNLIYSDFLTSETGITKTEFGAANYSLYKKTYDLWCIGDSLTNASEWPTLVRDMLRFRYSLRAGAIGQTMAHRTGVEDSIYDAIQNYEPQQGVAPSHILIWAGTNDFAYNVTIGDLETQYTAATRDVTTFYGAYMETIEKVMELYPQARIMLVGTPDRTWRVDGGDWKDAKEDRLNNAFLPDYVEATRKLAELYSLPFLDLLHTSGINKFNISQFMYMQTSGNQDYYLHFNSGYGTNSIGKRIAAFINSIG